MGRVEPASEPGAPARTSPQQVRQSRVLAVLFGASTLVAVSATVQAESHRREITIHAGIHSNGTYYLDASEVTVETGEELQVSLVNDEYPEGTTGAPDDPDKRHDVAIEGAEGPEAGGDCPAAEEEEGEDEGGEPRVELEACTQRTATANFTAPEDPGEIELEMACEGPGHAEGGTKGVMVVEESSALPGPGALAAAVALAGAAVGLRRRR